MTDFEKLCELLNTEPTLEFLESLVLGNEQLVIFWNEDGSIKDWGTLD